MRGKGTVFSVLIQIGKAKRNGVPDLNDSPAQGSRQVSESGLLLTRNDLEGVGRETAREDRQILKTPHVRVSAPATRGPSYARSEAARGAQDSAIQLPRCPGAAVGKLRSLTSS